ERAVPLLAVEGEFVRPFGGTTRREEHVALALGQEPTRRVRAGPAPTRQRRPRGGENVWRRDHARGPWRGVDDAEAAGDGTEGRESSSSSARVTTVQHHGDDQTAVDHRLE